MLSNYLLSSKVTSKISLNDLGRLTVPEIDLFVGSASFEERCLSIARTVAPRTRRAVYVRNSEFLASTEPQAREFQTLFKGRVSEARTSAMSPTATADVLLAEIIAPIRNLRGPIFVDITSFTHEQLLILLALISRQTQVDNIEIGYTGAAEYSTNTDEEHVWLSRGFRQVRSILGYPGKLAPSRRLHLIVLVGFESERARSLIEVMEPTKLSLGVGSVEQSVAPHHYARNARFASRLQEFLGSQTRIQAEVETFEFSCVDPFAAQDSILKQAAKLREFNTVVCPMNTKLSTVGAGLAGMRDQSIQLVYAAAEEYNEVGYSTPGKDVRLYTLSRPKLEESGLS